MSYVKLYDVSMDTCVGIENVNQTIDNNEAHRALYDAKHALGNGGTNTGGYSSPLAAVGRHDDARIARTVAHFHVDTSLAVPALEVLVSGPALSPLAYLRQAEGQWRIFVAAKHLLGVKATVRADATVDRAATCYLVFDPQTGPSVIVRTWEQDAGSWASTDLDFSLQLWLDRA